MQSPIEHDSPNGRMETTNHCKPLSFFSRDISSGESMVSEDSTGSKTRLDSDDQHSWIKLENSIELMISPMSSTEAPTSPSSTYSCESSEEPLGITSVPMIREEVQSYIGWTAIDAPFGNKTIKLPLQLSLQESRSVDALSSPPLTFDRHKHSSLHLPQSPSYTPINSFTNQAKLLPTSPKSPSRKISETFKDCFRKSVRREKLDGKKSH